MTTAADFERAVDHRRSFMLKRAFDIAIAITGLIILLPAMVVIALLVRLDSPGPVLYSPSRVGRYGREFRLHKFRTMVAEAHERGPAITGRKDPRITRLGQILRTLRIDELPQLLNVIRGDMSLVGPRPEDPTFVTLYTHQQLRILSARPGITSPASIAYRNEADILSGSNYFAAYVDSILPAKLAIDLAYIDQWTFTSDLAVIARTVGILLTNGASMLGRVHLGPHFGMAGTRVGGESHPVVSGSEPKLREERPRLAIVGGSDISLRASLVAELSHHFDVCVLGSGEDARSVFNPIGVEYRSYPMARGMSLFHDLFTVVALVHHFRALRPQIVHTYDTKPGVYGRISAWIARVPVIVGTLPGMGSLYVHDDGVVHLATRRLYETMQSTACRVAALTVLQNQDDLNDFVAKGVLTPSKAVLMRGASGVDTQRFHPQKLRADDAAKLRASLGVGDGTLVVTMVGRIIRSKGVLEYAAAARQVIRQFPQVRFLLVGQHGHGSRETLTHAERSDLDEAVNWLGHREDVADLLGITDLFVLPSFYMEGIPRVLLEAAASGVPIITTDSRGCRDVVQDQVTGVLIPPRNADALADALLALLRDPLKRARLGQEARALAVAEFDVRAVAGRLRELYLEQLKLASSSEHLGRTAV